MHAYVGYSSTFLALSHPITIIETKYFECCCRATHANSLSAEDTANTIHKEQKHAAAPTASTKKLDANFVSSSADS